MSAAAKDWYAAPLHLPPREPEGAARRKHVSEERTVLLRAGSDNEAIKLAEPDARKYAEQDGGITYLHCVETYHLFAASIRSGAGVFSLMRSSNRSAAGFASWYYDDGSEHRRKWARGRRRATR